MKRVFLVFAFLAMTSFAGPAQAGVVCFYEHINYEGASACWESGDVVYNLTEFGWNDVISSVTVEGGAVVVYVDANHSGASVRFASNLYDLRYVKYQDGNTYNWNDLISSFYVE